jgi:hypothetical protein
VFRALRYASPEPSRPSEAAVLSSVDCHPSSSHDERDTDLLVVTCPRCGHADRMLASSYALWVDGILCGLCGPPWIKMRVTARQRGAAAP